MADGDYERGRGRELAQIRARLKALASQRAQARLAVLVLNGWAASPAAWDLCRFPRERIYSYLEQLDDAPERRLASLDGRAVLVGWSMGGSSALRLACRFREKIAGLVLVAATPRMLEDPATEWPGMRERRIEALWRGAELTHGEGFFGIPEGKPDPYISDSGENLGRGIKYLRETDTRAELERVFGNRKTEFPVFLFHSEKDAIVHPHNMQYLKRIFPQAQCRTIPGTEHALSIFIPSEIDDAVNACLSVAAPRQDT